MKVRHSITTIVFIFFLMTSFSAEQEHDIQFSCFRKNSASNTCYFNFKVDGAPFTYVDNGCKWEGRKDDIITRAKSGSLGLAKDWKIQCPSVKPETEKKVEEGF